VGLLTLMALALRGALSLLAGLSLFEHLLSMLGGTGRATAKVRLAPALALLRRMLQALPKILKGGIITAAARPALLRLGLLWRAGVPGASGCVFRWIGAVLVACHAMHPFTENCPPEFPGPFSANGAQKTGFLLRTLVGAAEFRNNRAAETGDDWDRDGVGGASLIKQHKAGRGGGCVHALGRWE